VADITYRGDCIRLETNLYTDGEADAVKPAGE
jgi:hypothetical protein